MITKDFTIQLSSVEEAPKYDLSVKMIKIDRVIIVKKGMESGKCSVDIQGLDKDGNKYLIFTTGELMKMIALAVEGVNNAN